MPQALLRSIPNAVRDILILNLLFSTHTHLFSLVFSSRDGRQPGAGNTTVLERFLCQSTEETLDIAGGANQIILESDFCLSAITGLAHAIAAHQFALRSFDAITPVHLLLERIGLHFPAALLQK